MALLRTHAYTGTAGATISAAAEAYNASSGTNTYAAGGIGGGSCHQVAAAATAYLEDTTFTAPWYAIYVKFPTIPTTGDTVFASRMNGTTVVANLGIIATGELRVFSALGTTAATFTTKPAANTWYRIEWQVISTGQTVKLYTETGSTPIETKTGVIVGTTAPNRARIGHVQSAKAVGATLLDQVTAHDTEPLLGVASNIAPTANAGSNLIDVEPRSTVTLDGSGSDSDGTIASLVWTQTGGTPTVTLSGGGVDPTTFVAPETAAGTTLTFTLTATDNLGATGTDTMTVTILRVYERAVIGGVEVPIRLSSVSS